MPYYDAINLLVDYQLHIDTLYKLVDRAVSANDDDRDFLFHCMVVMRDEQGKLFRSTNDEYCRIVWDVHADMQRAYYARRS